MPRVIPKRVAIHSVPRSGSSWLGQIFNSHPYVNYKYQPLFSYSFKSALNFSSTKEDILKFFKDIAVSNDDFLNAKEYIAKGFYPEFIKNDSYKHIVYKEVRYHHLLSHLMKVDDELVVIGLIRNPKAVINSWFKAPSEFKKDQWKLEEEWYEANKKNLQRPEEFYGFKKWLECYDIFNNLKNKYPNRFMIVVYDDLLKNTIYEVKRIFKFCGLEINSQTESFIQNSKEKEFKDQFSVYKLKKKDKSWENELPKNIINDIDKILEERKLNYLLD